MMAVQLVSAQTAYYDISNKSVYDFIDELANDRIIQLNTPVKPYSRKVIAEKLMEAYEKKGELSSRQLKEVEFYLRDFQKELSEKTDFKKRLDLFSFRNDDINITVNPILGINYFTNDSGSFYHRWNGAQFTSYFGERFALYASLRDNRQNSMLANANYLNQNEAADYKVDGSGGGDFSEMRGGMVYSWKWGDVGLVKDRFTWGDQYHGANIFSGHTPSFAHIKLSLHPINWFYFNYVHAWLNSESIDSSYTYQIYGANRIRFRNKYMAANLATFLPFKNFSVSVGNSIVYGDIPVQAAYLVPVFFYKSVDHSLTGAGSNYLGQNSQMFFNLSSRNIKHLHLYASIFIDEVSFSNVWDQDKQSNFFSGKFGAHITNLGFSGYDLTVEYTRNNPLTYRHYIPTATFASNNYNLGHYLGDNAQEMFFGANIKPLPKLQVSLGYTLAKKGVEYFYSGQSGTSGSGKGHPFLNSIYWENKSIEVKAQYQIINDCFVYAGLENSDQSGIEVKTYSQPYYRGKRTTINAGLNIGF